MQELPLDLYEDSHINIFILDEKDYEFSAILHPDKLIVKMILEQMQMASTAIAMLAEPGYAEQHNFYRATHRAHPNSIWTRESKANFLELVDRTHVMHEEYLRRGFSFHNSYNLCMKMRKAVEVMNFPKQLSTPYARCFNKSSNIVKDETLSTEQQYRSYVLTKSYTSVSDPIIMYLKDVPESAVFGNPQIAELYQQIKSAT